jgi:Na+/melibiose symporter-like transporter
MRKSSGSTPVMEVEFMSIGTILVIILIVFLLGGFSGRFRGYGYGFGHTGIGVLGVILIVVIVLLLTGRI